MMTKKEKVKNFVKEHEKGLAVVAIATSVLGAIGLCKYATKSMNNCGWVWDIPWSENDKIGFAKRWIKPDKFKDEVVIGLRNVTLDEIVEEGKKALVASGKNEDTIIQQVILSTIKESK